MAERGPLKVYYDAACSGCHRHRARYERWAGETGSDVIWCDLNQDHAELRVKGIEPKTALLSLHVEDAQGSLHEGMDAYILLMRRVPRLTPLAWMIALPGIKQVLRYFYDHWVKWRLTRQGRLP